MRTCVFLALALQGQGGAPSGAAAESDIVSLLWRSSPLTQGVLLILILFSAVSWAIILYKTWQFQRARKQSGSFLDILRRSSKFSEVQAVCNTLKESPLVGIFQAGYAELTTQLKSAAPAAATIASGDPRPSLEERYRSHEEYVRAVSKAASKVVHEGYLLQQDADAMIKQAEASDILR